MPHRRRTSAIVLVLERLHQAMAVVRNRQFSGAPAIPTEVVLGFIDEEEAGFLVLLRSHAHYLTNLDHEYCSTSVARDYGLGLVRTVKEFAYSVCSKPKLNITRKASALSETVARDITLLWSREWYVTPPCRKHTCLAASDALDPAT